MLREIGTDWPIVTQTKDPVAHTGMFLWRGIRYQARGLLTSPQGNDERPHGPLDEV